MVKDHTDVMLREVNIVDDASHNYVPIEMIEVLLNVTQPTPLGRRENLAMIEVLVLAIILFFAVFGNTVVLVSIMLSSYYEIIYIRISNLNNMNSSVYYYT